MGTGAQHVHGIDAVRAGEHPVNQRHDLAARRRRARRLVPEPHALVHELLDPQPLSQRPAQQQPGVTDQTLLIERTPTGQDSSGVTNVRYLMHHMGDLLVQAAVCRYDSF